MVGLFSRFVLVVVTFLAWYPGQDNARIVFQRPDELETEQPLYVVVAGIPRVESEFKQPVA